MGCKYINKMFSYHFCIINLNNQNMKNLKTSFLVLSLIVVSTICWGMPVGDRTQLTQDNVQSGEHFELPTTTITENIVIPNSKKRKGKKKLKAKIREMIMSSDVESGKTAAIIGYIGFFGLIISLIALHKKGNTFSAFHLRQSLGLTILYLVPGLVGIFLPGVLGLVFSILAILVFVAWIISFISAIKGEMKTSFLFGEQFQKWFANTIK